MISRGQDEEIIGVFFVVPEKEGFSKREEIGANSRQVGVSVESVLDELRVKMAGVSTRASEVSHRDQMVGVSSARASRRKREASSAGEVSRRGRVSARHP